MHSTRALRAPTPLPTTATALEEAALPAVCAADIGRDDLAGLSLESYDLGRVIGGGGMGRVYAARHRRLDRTFAIKFITVDQLGDGDAALRFDEETRALGRLQHPHIVNAVDAGCLHGLRYLVTELVEGVDLGALVSRHGPLPVAEACELIRQAANGLAYSHSCGFLHRDIKPSNLMLDQTGTVKLLDFGLVGKSHQPHELTQPGTWLGTLEFMSPEQAHDAASVDERSDLYSLGCTLLYLLSGEVPFGADRYAAPAAKLKGHLFDQPQWLARPPASVPRELLEILKKLLAKSPGERYQSAADVATVLEPFAAEATVMTLLPLELRSASGSTIPRSTPSRTAAPHAKPVSRSHRTALLAGGAVALLSAASLTLTLGIWIGETEAKTELAVVSFPPVNNAEIVPDEEPSESLAKPIEDPIEQLEPSPRSAALVTQEASTTVNAAPLDVSGPLQGIRRPRRFDRNDP